MSGHRMQETKFRAPELQPVAGAPAQGQRVNTPAPEELSGRGWLTKRSAEAVRSPFGEGSRRLAYWFGLLPGGAEPEPGWEVETAGKRFRVRTVKRVAERWWRLVLEGV